jgi:hypothetical protein
LDCAAFFLIMSPNFGSFCKEALALPGAFSRFPVHCRYSDQITAMVPEKGIRCRYVTAVKFDNRRTLVLSVSQ